MSKFLTELVLRPFPSTAQFDGKNWVLMQDMLFNSQLIGELIVPRGFITDLASTPQALWSDLPPGGKWAPAAVAHDYLYFSQPCTRETADRVLLEAMRDLNVDDRRCMLIFEGVRVGGQHAWDKDAADRAAGKPHVST